jgi:hypothetical protein
MVRRRGCKGSSLSWRRFIILDPNGEYRECFKDLTPLIDVRVFSAEPKLGEKELIVPAWMWKRSGMGWRCGTFARNAKANFDASDSSSSIFGFGGRRSS